MLSYLLIFLAVAFFIRVPFFLLGLVFRFSKPLALIGFGSILGVMFTTGLPDLSQFTPASQANPHNSQANDPSDNNEAIGPKLIEAALDLADRAESSISTLLAETQDSWQKGSQQKMTTARKSASQDFGALAGSLWDRKKQAQSTNLD